MDDDWESSLTGITPGIRRLAAGEVLFRRGEAVAGLYRIETGRLLVRRNGVTLQRAEAGDTLGEAELFRPVHDSDAEAGTSCRVRIWPKAQVILFIRAHPDIGLAFAATLARRLEQARTLAELARLNGAETRIAAWLRLLGADRRPVAVSLPLVRIAASLGLTHEAFYRTLAALKRDGRLERPDKRTFRLIA